MPSEDLSIYEAAGLAEIAASGSGAAASEAHYRLVQAYGADGRGIFEALGAEDSLSSLSKIHARHGSLREWVLLSRKFPEQREEYLLAREEVLEETQEMAVVPEPAPSPVQKTPLETIQESAAGALRSLPSRGEAKPRAFSDLPASSNEILRLLSISWGLRKTGKVKLAAAVSEYTLHKHALRVAQEISLDQEVDLEDSWVSVFSDLLEVEALNHLAEHLGSDLAGWRELFGKERGKVIYGRALEMDMLEEEAEVSLGVLKDISRRLLCLMGEDGEDS